MTQTVCIKPTPNTQAGGLVLQCAHLESVTYSLTLVPNDITFVHPKQECGHAQKQATRILRYFDICKNKYRHNSKHNKSYSTEKEIILMLYNAMAVVDLQMEC